MSLQAIETKRLYEQVAEQIASLIHSGKWGPGSRLPSERAMSQQLGVSRPTVREAILFLDIVGLVEVRTGAGIYVKEDGPSPEIGLVGRDFGPSPYDLMDARALIESEIAAQVAATATTEQLTGMRQAIEKMESDIDKGVQDPAKKDDGDLLFHTRLAGATDNPVLVAIVDQLWAGMRQTMFKTFSERVRMPDNARRAARDHRAVLSALEQGDAEGARRAMRDHLEQVKGLLFSDNGDHSEEK